MVSAFAASAAVVAAGVTFTVVMLAVVVLTVVMLAVVIALHVRIVCKRTVKQCRDRRVAIARDTAVKLDAAFGKCRLCASADATANQRVRADRTQYARECAVPLTVRRNDLGIRNRVVFHRVDLELLGATEVSEDLSVFMCYCNFHMLVLRKIKS